VIFGAIEARFPPSQGQRATLLELDRKCSEAEWYDESIKEPELTIPKSLYVRWICRSKTEKTPPEKARRLYSRKDRTNIEFQGLK